MHLRRRHGRFAAVIYTAVCSSGFTNVGALSDTSTRGRGPDLYFLSVFHFPPTSSALLWAKNCLSESFFPVFCCYLQVYDIFTMSCLAVILQVSSHDGMLTPQNSALLCCILTVSPITYLPGWFPVAFPCDFRLPECPSRMVGPP